MEEENDRTRLQLPRQVYSKISGFFETRVENPERPAPPPAVRSLARKKKKIPRNGKLSPSRILTKIPQTMRNLQARRNSVSIMENVVIQ